jgi:hypothetical protein
MTFGILSFLINFVSLKIMLNEKKSIIIKPRIMKKSALFITGILLILFSEVIYAQTLSGFDFFSGKWNVVVTGSPMGDVHMVVNFIKTNDVITATLKDTTGRDLYKVTNTEIKNDQAVIKFIGTMGDEVPFMLRKRDENSVSGDIMGYESEGKRISKVE